MKVEVSLFRDVMICMICKRNSSSEYFGDFFPTLMLSPVLIGLNSQQRLVYLDAHVGR